MNNYLVVYNFPNGTGNIEISTSLPLGFKSLPEIYTQIAQKLKESYGMSLEVGQLVITNIIKMESV